MSENITTGPPDGFQSFHYLITSARKGEAIYHSFLGLTHQKLETGISYGHFMHQLKSGGTPVGQLPALALAMELNGIDPEPAMMAFYAACCKSTEPANGSLDDEFCDVVEELGKIAETIRTGIALKDMALQDAHKLNLIIGKLSAAAQHMAHELLHAQTVAA